MSSSGKSIISTAQPQKNKQTNNKEKEQSEENENKTSASDLITNSYRLDGGGGMILLYLDGQMMLLVRLYG